MKKLIPILCLFFALSNSAKAQTDVALSMGSAYANNVWYSLEDGQTGSAAVSGWDVAFVATASQSSVLTTSALFNTKLGKLYTIPGATPANFATADTAGLSTWTPLYNDPTSWASGAFNKPSAGGLDYGWGSYNTTTHNVDANRVFVIKYTSGLVKKMHLTLNSIAGTYTFVYDNYDNSDLHTQTINIATYNTKNFVYYSLSSNAIVDREPVASGWDFLLTQYYDMYPASVPTSMQQVGGVLHNLGVEVAQAKNVDQATYEDYASHTFDAGINSIGFNWKNLNYTTFLYETESTWVYFVKRSNDDIWKVVFTEFIGSSNGNYAFTKEKIYTATTAITSGTETSTDNLVLYPNPVTNGETTVLYTATEAGETSLELYDLAGNQIKQWAVHSKLGLNAYTIQANILNPGMYTVSVRSNENTFQQKLSVQ